MVVICCESMRRFRVDGRFIALLSALEDWAAPGDLQRAGHAVDPLDLDRLVGLGVLEREGDQASTSRAGSVWNPYDLVVQRQTTTGGARDAEARSQLPRPPGLAEGHRQGATVSLPAPRPLPADDGLGKLLARRRSRRAYADRAMGLGELSTLLHHSARVVQVSHDDELGDMGLRPFAGAGARSELEVYVVAYDVDGLASGAYHYDAHCHSLVHVRAGDEHHQRLKGWVHTTTEGALNRDPQVVLIITAVFARVMWKYQGIGLALIYKDTGCLMQTLYLVATALGLAPCALGGGEELANSRWLGLDPLQEAQVGCFLVGPAASTAARPIQSSPGERRRAPGPDHVLKLSQGYVTSAVLRSGVELGVYECLGRQPSTAEQVAQSIGGDPRGTRILLDALVAIGLAERSGELFATTPVAQRYLVSRSPTFLGTRLGVFCNDVLWEALGKLSEAVRHGGSRLADNAGSPVHPYWEAMARALAPDLDPSATAMAELLAPWAEGRAGLTILDVGCGNGAYGYAMALRRPEARVFSLDGPDVLAVAQESAQRLGILDRVTYLAGDMFDVALGGPYDLAILSQVLHHLDVPRCQALLRRVADALAPDGQVVIHDLVRGAAPPRADPGPYLFSVLMLAWSPSGEVHTLPEYQAMLDEAGFVQPTVEDLPGAASRLLIAGRRPPLTPEKR
jgi:C-methyltransferase